MTTLHLSLYATDVLMMATLGAVFLAVRRATGSLPLAAALTGIALSWGAAWSFIPALSALRLVPPPGGQGLAIALLTLVLSLIAVTSRAMRHADLMPLVGIAYWRIVYGVVLLLSGGAGQLPEAFFWSAAVGDILAGLFGMAIVGGHLPATRTSLLTWNIFGLADLLHVLALGVTTLRPFYLAHPDVLPLNMLPLAGVPVLIALHVGGLAALWQQRAPMARAAS
jgi:hypothetical protein